MFFIFVMHTYIHIFYITQDLKLIGKMRRNKDGIKTIRVVGGGGP